VEGGKVHGLTFPLLTTAGGRKMGKTEASAVWLDAARTSPYDYYQFWINADDRDVGRFLRLFTLLSLEEIESLEKLAGAELRRAKEALAFEATVLTHGREEAEKARQTARALFVVNPATAVSNSVALDPVALAIPTFKLLRQSLEQGIPAVKVFAECGLCESRNAARRLAEQKGLYVNGQAIEKERLLTMSDLMDGAILLRAGKKKHMRVILT
jgi:tyrosyl-tRNA synthetase